MNSYNESNPIISFRIKDWQKKKLDNLAKNDARYENTGALAKEILVKYLSGELVENTESKDAKMQDLKMEKLSEEIQKSLDNVQNLIDTEEFKQAIQSSVEESIQNLQKNPSPVRKSQGNKDFNNPENHVQTDEVDSNSIHPFNVSKSDMEKLNKEERLSVLNRGLSVMTGFSS